MCGRYVQTMPADAMRELFRTSGALPNLAPSWNGAPPQCAPVVGRHPDPGAPAARPLPTLPPSWNVAPTQSAPVVRRHPETGERHLDPLRWGLRPRWAKDGKGARGAHNAPAHPAAAAGVRAPPEPGERHLAPLRWGLRPRWAKAEKGAREPINARAETVATNGMFRYAYAKRRCLGPAAAVYDWGAR